MDLRIALPVALVLTLSACGASDSVTPQAPAGETQAGAVTDLKITVDPGDGKTQDSTLTCEPTGGTVKDPTAACATLASKGATAMPPVGRDKMCTQIYGGSQTATVTGTWAGKTGTWQFNRKNGCEVSRWNALKGLLPDVAGVAGPQ